MKSFTPRILPSINVLLPVQATLQPIPAVRCASNYDENYPLKSKRYVKKRQSSMVSKMIRVDHAGELAADRIYAGQLAVLKNTKHADTIREMWEEEKVHLATFQRLLPEYRVRPTIMLPIWNVASYALGAGTALLGSKSAMACTIAVEEVIGEHYNAQLRDLLAEDPEKYSELLAIITKFRDDELHHLNTGVEHDGEQAPFYDVLKGVIQVGCRGAIWISERI